MSSWNYFLSFIGLLGDVCANRNKFGKKWVDSFITLEIICSIIESPECESLNLLGPFLKLVHMAFVDIPVYATIRRIARVREWDIIETKNDIIKTHAEDKYKPDKTPLKRVKNFINNYITSFKHFDPKH